MEALFRIGFQSGGPILRLPLPKPSGNKAEEATPLSAILEPLVRQKQRYRANSESTLGSYHQGTAAEFVLLGVFLRRPAWAPRFLTGLLPSVLRRERHAVGPTEAQEERHESSLGTFQRRERHGFWNFASMEFAATEGGPTTAEQNTDGTQK